MASGTPEVNAVIVRKLLNNELEENNPILDYVLINTATGDWKHGVELARESIRSGKAWKRVMC